MSRHVSWIEDGVVDDLDEEIRTAGPRPDAATRALPPVDATTELDAVVESPVAESESDQANQEDRADAGEPVRTRSRRRPPLWAVGALVVVLLLLAGAVATGVIWARGAATAGGREDALAAGRQAAVNLTSVDFNHAEADVQRVLDGATGDFGGLFGQNMDSYVSVVKQGKVVTKGEVAEAGIQTFDGDAATVVVAVKASVQNDGTPNGEERFYRLVEDMEKHDGRWLVSRVEFVP